MFVAGKAAKAEADDALQRLREAVRSRDTLGRIKEGKPMGWEGNRDLQRKSLPETLWFCSEGSSWSFEEMAETIGREGLMLGQGLGCGQASTSPPHS